MTPFRRSCCAIAVNTDDFNGNLSYLCDTFDFDIDGQWFIFDVIIEV